VTLPAKRARPNRQGSGRKPSNAYVLEAEALANLQHKVEVLKEFISGAMTEESRRRLALEVPTSGRQFHTWECEWTSPPLRHSSALTLKKYPALKLAVPVLLAQAKARRAPASPNKNLVERVAGVRRKVQMHRVLRQIAEAEMVNLRREGMRLRADLENAQCAFASFERKAQAKLSELEAQLADSEAARAKLTAQLHKVVPLRSKRRG
jgi:hypothetical protein